MGFFGNLDPEAYDRQYTDRELLSRMARYFQPHKRDLLILVSGVALTGALDVIFPVAISQGLNALAQHTTTTFLVVMVGLVLAAGVLSWGVNYLRRRLTARTIGQVVFAASAFRPCEMATGKMTSSAPVRATPATRMSRSRLCGRK